MKLASRFALILALVCFMASFAAAVDEPKGTTAAPTVAADTAVKTNGPGIGMGLSVVGAGLGIGLIGFSALSSMARQPEMAGRISGSMILLAALVEGAAVISLALCFLIAR
jgi:ATP synthase F0 subunit c